VHDDLLKPQGLTEEMLQDFTDLWAAFDPLATQYILASQFQEFLLRLPPPLGPVSALMSLISSPA
jgi:hypothetical protein